MARTAHRTLIISAAFALASWALVAGAPVLAAAPPEHAGPSLPPAEYKPLPVGTVVTYDTWGYTVTKTEGFDITFKTTAGNWKHYYAVFGKHGDNVYLSGECRYDCEDWESDLDAESRAALENIWPLKVGEKVKLNSEESKSGYSGFPTTRPWTVALEVVRAEILELNGLLYSTYVIQEHAVSEGVIGPYASAGPEGYLETKWYDPESGLVLKSVKEMTRGPKKGDRKEYSLVHVRFPQGTKTHVLAGTKAPSAPPPAAARPPAARPLVRPPAPARPAMAGPMAKKPRRMARADPAAAPVGDASLPPAEYKPLPVGTVVTYDTWGYTVTKSDGFDITYKTNSGDWRHDYAVFGRHGDGAYGMSSEWKAILDNENKAALESFWPPKVGNKIVLYLEDELPKLSAYVGESTRNWTVTLEVLGTAFLDLNSFRYPTYVIREHAISESVSTFWTEIPSPEYSETKWYNPESGLVLKSVKDWTRGPKKGEEEEYSLVRVRFPQGTKTNVLAGTEVPGGGGAGPDPRLTAEIARLKREAAAKQKALAAVKGSGSEELRRQREEQKRLMAQVARLTQEAEERRRAEEKRKAEEEARLKAEAERQRKAKVAARAPAPASDLQRQIAVLKQLRDSGLITGQQFTARQKDLLDRFVGAPKTATARLTAPKSPQAVLQARLAKYSGINFGRYYALVIGNNEYKHLPNLKTAANDARAVADILRETYGFDVTLLIDATRADIIEALDDFRETLDDTTNLLIYYAGHGWLDEAAGQGYWLPVDAKPDRRSNWVANATITGTLRALNAKHVMVVADSCYSGTLVRGIKIKENTPDYIRRMAGKRARLALTSGGLEPVADSGGGKHSPFAAAFIDVLKANTSVIDGTQLFSQMRRPVILNSDQTPQYSDVRRAGHEGGDFLFVRKR